MQESWGLNKKWHHKFVKKIEINNFEESNNFSMQKIVLIY